MQAGEWSKTGEILQGMATELSHYRESTPNGTMYA
jgi:hypothetical protein